MTAYKKNSSYKMHELPVVTFQVPHMNVCLLMHPNYFAVRIARDAA